MSDLALRVDLATTVRDMISSKILKASDMEIEIRKAPKRANGTAYVSLTPIGVKPGDKIVVVSTKDILVVMKWAGDV